MVGAVKVAGMTLDEIEADLLARYTPKYMAETHISVQVATYKTIDVCVLGDIRTPPAAVLGGQPQLVQLRRDRTSVLNAILAAGGPTEFGGLVTLIPARAPDKPQTFDLSNRADLIRAARVGTVGDSDVIIVDGRASDAVYVYGLVTNPGPVPMPRGATRSVWQVIAAAGGPLLAFEPKEATLVRRKPDGEVTRVKIDLERLREGKALDIALAAGDVLVVPHTSGTRFEEFLAKTFRFGFGVDATYYPWIEYNLRKDRETYDSGQGFYSVFGQSLLQQGLARPIYTPTTGQ